MQTSDREITLAPTSVGAPPGPENREWLTAEQASTHAGIGVGTIRQACNRNELRHIRVGGGAKGPIRTRREWVDEWLEKWARGGQAM
jgi:excisionase family DNA binding protein